jgi:hypothetical protein
MQWLQDPSQINWYNLNNVRCGVSGHFGNKEGEYVRDEINVGATNSMNKNIRVLHISRLR